MIKKTTYNFPPELNDLRNDLAALIPLLEGNDSDLLYGFVSLEDLVQHMVHISHTENIGTQRDRGLVLRIYAGGKNFEYATNDLDMEALKKQAARLHDAALAYSRSHPEYKAYVPPRWSEEDLDSLHPLMRAQLPSVLTPDTPVHFANHYDPDYEYNMNPRKMAEYARSIREELVEKAGPTLAAAGMMLRQKVKTRLFIDRYKNMSQCLLSSLHYLYGVTGTGITARHVKGGLTGYEDILSTRDKAVAHVVDIAARLVSAEKLKPGRYQIITGPDVTGVIAHEAFGHTQEGDTCRLGRSCAPGLKKDKVKVGNDQATILNNPAFFSMSDKDYGQNGSHFFDDEGWLARPQVILDQGYLSTPMNDLISSQKGDINGPAPRQSNGKRESWRRPLIPRQTNTYFTAGDKSLEDLISMVDYGFIAEYAHGGMEDPKGMGLTAGTEYLEEIKQGNRTGKVFLGPQGGHIELSDPVPQLLSNIIAKSTVDGRPLNEQNKNAEPINKWGGCGKYHKEGVEAGSGGPYILWDRIKCG